MQLRVCFEPEAPLLLGTGRALQNQRETGRYIPGSTVLGAIAEPLLRFEGSFRASAFDTTHRVSPELRKILELLRIGPLYPVTTKEGELPPPGTQGFPAPLSARSCKYRPGFPDAGVGSGHGVVDLLLLQIARSEGGNGVTTGRGDLGAAPTEARAGGACLTCGQRVERFRELVVCRASGGPGGAPRYGTVKVTPHLQTRIGLNRRTETAEHEILYQVESIGPGADPLSTEERLVFLGAATLPEDLWEPLRERLDAAAGRNGVGGWYVAIGGNRSRGFGWGQLHLLPEADTWAWGWGSPKERFERFAARLDSALGAVGRARGAGRTAPLYLPACLYSPWPIPLAGAGVSPADTFLAAFPPPPLVRSLQFAPEASFLETESWGGWSMAWGLPKSCRPALAPGSVLTFRLDNPRPGDIEVLLEWLAWREGEGRAGVGSESGLGCAVWFHPFHVDLAAT